MTITFAPALREKFENLEYFYVASPHCDGLCRIPIGYKPDHDEQGNCCHSPTRFKFTLDNIYRLGSKWMYINVYGEVPVGKVVSHLCHNRNCVNPDHLVLETSEENLSRTSADGHNPIVDLSAEDRRDIRYMVNDLGMDRMEVAVEYGVQRRRIRRIVTGKVYGDES